MTMWSDENCTILKTQQVNLSTSRNILPTMLPSPRSHAAIAHLVINNGTIKLGHLIIKNLMACRANKQQSYKNKHYCMLSIL